LEPGELRKGRGANTSVKLLRAVPSHQVKDHRGVSSTLGRILKP
jgi:hypothetical protein